LHLSYPKTHDLAALVHALNSAGVDLRRVGNVEVYTAFGVQYRYSAYDPMERPLDRPRVVEDTAALLAHVQSVIDSSAP
jgi:hypothetical protein